MEFLAGCLWGIASLYIWQTYKEYSRPVTTVKQEDKVIPVTGEKWVLHAKDDPWAPSVKPVDIIDVRNGWVRYAIVPCFPDSRMEVDMFTRIYKPVRD